MSINNKISSKGWFIFPITLLMIFSSLVIKAFPENVKYSVEEVYWIRLLEIKKYVWVETSDWEDELKGDSRIILKNNKEIRVYEDSSFPEKGLKEIYSNKVYYKVKMYKTIGYKKLTGIDNNPIYPELGDGVGEDGKKDISGEKIELLKVKLKKIDNSKNGKEFEYFTLSEKLFKERYLKNNVVEMKVLNSEKFKLDKDEWIYKEDDLMEELEIALGNTIK
jgi:hypothetical protein